MKYIDIHSHLNFPDLEAELDAVVGRMKETETGTIVVGTDYESSKRAVEIAEKYDNIWACIGVHPVDDPSKTFEVEKFEELAKSSKVVAVGECGLDYFRRDKGDGAERERQEKLFIAQIEFALAHDLPIMIHAREAYIELLDMLGPLKREHPDTLRGNVHFFAGTMEEAQRFWDIDFTTSFTGVITFADQYNDVIKNAPLEMLMSETDAPFVTPAPHRGKRNEPAFVVEVVKKIAELRGEDFETVRKTLLSSAKRVFNIGDWQIKYKVYNRYRISCWNAVVWSCGYSAGIRKIGLDGWELIARSGSPIGIRPPAATFSRDRLPGLWRILQRQWLYKTPPVGW